MNKVYKTVWNALRGQLVVVNEVTTGHSQANTHKTSTVLISSTVTPQFAKATLATLIAGLISTSALAFTGDKVLNNAWDLSGGQTNFNSLVVQSKGDLTINKEITSDGESFNDPDAKLEVNTTLTNQGKVHGDAQLAGKKIVNEATGTIDMGKVAVVAPQQNNEAIVNKGSIKVGTLEAGVATVKNEKDLEVTNALALEGKLVNTSTATKLKLADAAVTGELANDAMTGVDVTTLNVNGAGKVTGQGKMTVAGALTVTENASFDQNELDVAATVTNAGTMNVQALKQTQQKGIFTNQKTANLGDVDGVGTITNDTTGTMNVTGTLHVKHVASNAGTLTANVLNVEGDAATFTNIKKATITNASGTGSVVNETTGDLTISETLTVQNAVTNKGIVTAKTVNVNSGALNSAGTQLKVNVMNVEGGSLNNTAKTGTEIGTLNVNTGKVVGTGALTVTGTTTLKQGASIAQQDLTLNTLDADGLLSVTGQFVGNGVSTFKANATGTISHANFKGAVDHSGQMVFNAVTSDANITNTAGKLTIKSLEGNAHVTNATGATLDMTAGTAQMATLVGNGTTQLGTATATGKITNTGTMTSTGRVTVGAFDQNAASAQLASMNVSGLLNVAGGDLTVDTLLTAKQAQNTSTIHAKDMTITGSLVNDKTLTVTNSADLTGFTQHDSGTSQFHQVGFRGNGSIEGTVVADDDMLVDTGANYTGSGSITSKSSLRIKGALLATGRVEAQGLTTVGQTGTLKAHGLSLSQTDISGTVESTGNGSIDNLYMRSGATLKNSGKLTVKNVRTTAGGTYEQTGDNASITFTSGTWFSSTNINLFGGTMDRSGTHLGQNNAYIVKSDSYKGALGGDISSTNWKDGMAILKVGQLTTSNTVEMQKGGLLEVQQIALGSSIGVGKGTTLTLNGGAMETTLDQFFKGVKSDALAWEALNPDTGRIDVVGSDVLGVNSVGELNDGIVEHVKFTTGDLIFKDSIDFGQITTVSNKLKPLGEVSIHFLGKTNKLMTVDVANGLSDANSPTKIIFDRNTLYASTSDEPAAGKAIYVGGEAGEDGLSLKSGVGFQNVALTDKVTVQQGAEFTLIGKEDQTHSALIGEHGGTMEVTGEGSKFILGTLGRTGMTGKLEKASTTAGGLIDAKGGDYQIETLEAVNGGKIETGAANLTTATNLKVTGASSTLDNAGTLKVTNFADDASAVIGNAGVMNVTSATNVLGQMTNKKGGTLKVDGKLTVTGKLVNEAAESTRNGHTGIQVGALDVVSDEAVINKGVFVSKGENVITGASTDNPLTSGKYAFHNQKGAVADLSQGLTTIGAAPSVGSSGLESRTEGGYTVVKNEGAMKFGDVVVNDFATLRNTGADAQIDIEKLSMDGWSTFENSGTATIKTLEAYGLIRNKGTIQSSKLETSNFTNSAKGSEGRGVIVDEVLNVVAGGQFKNEKDGIVDAFKAKMSLAAKAKARNEGIMSARELLLAEGSNFKNAGALALNDLYMGGGRFENEGIVSYDNATILGQYVNKGTGQMTIGKNEPTLVGGHMTVKGEGSFENHGQTTVLADLSVEGKGKVLQTGKDGKFAVDTLTIKDEGSVVVSDGKMAVAKYIDLQGGSFAVEGHADAATRPTVALMLKDEINGRIAVDNGSLTLGLWKSLGTEGESATQANRIGLPHAKATLIASDAPLKLGSNGTMAVGTDAKDKALSNGSAWFGSDSLFVIDTSKMTTLEKGGSAALVGNGTGQLTVSEGAQLHVANVGWGTYYVTKDFADEVVSDDAWGKLNSFSPEDPGKALTIKQDKDGNVLLTVGSGDIRDKLHTIGTPNLVNKVIGDPAIRDVNDKGVVGFISKAVEDGILDKNKQAEVINDVTQIGAAGGLMMQGLTLNNNVLDQVDRHLSFEDAHFKSGELQPWNTVRLWGDAMGQKSEVKGAGFSGSETAFDADNMGFIVGVDFMVQNDIRHGFAFAAQKGDLTTKGHMVSTTNKADSYSGVWYLAKHFGQLNVMGSMGWTHIQSDVNQNLGFMDHGEHSLNTKTDIMSVGMKAELYCPLSSTWSVIPHVGVRAVNVSSMDTTSKMNANNGFRYETGALTQWQLPIGMTLEGRHQTASGWLTRGVLDVSVTPILGDKAEKTTVSSRAIAHGVTDHVTADVADSTTSTIRFGLSTQKDGLTLGGQFGVAQGDMRDRDVTFNLSARYEF